MWDRFSLPLRSEHFPLYRTIHRYYFNTFRQFPNLRSCSTFNEKIQWLKLFDQGPEIVRCTDKLTARDYVSNRAGSEFLVKLLQSPSSFDEINFDKLPNSFVLKTNHDSSTAVLVRDKSSLDRNAVRSKITAALQRIWGQETGEWSYAFIKPRIFIEQLLSSDGSIPPPDYKFHCVNGKVRFLQYIYDRGMDTKEQISDIDANPLPIRLDLHFRLGNAFRKPAGWNHLIDVAERIATGFKYVRVDLYHIHSKIFFGEMTFWPYGGFYLGGGQALLGRYLDFDRSSTKAPIFRR
jgi:teichuronopeptide biosynthesis TupA-like protein